jgi:hypothetical protein
MTSGETCDHEWGVEDLALTGSGDAVDVCISCGALAFHSDA